MKPYLLIMLASVLAVAAWHADRPSSAQGAAGLTLPILDFDAESWLDHTSPAVAGLYADNSTTMTRYDGTTGWSYNGHAGLDYPTNWQEGFNALAGASGSVVYRGWQDPMHHEVGFGFYVRVWHSAFGYSTLYGHLNGDSLVTVGQQVARGATVGHTGNSGYSTGPHLHFGVYNSQSGWTPIDPYGWSGDGGDPWPYDQGYLWTDNPPAYPAESCYQPVDSATGSGHFPGVFRPKPDGTWWHERFSNTAGIANRSFNFATTCDIPLVGDWNCDYIWTPGIFRPVGSSGYTEWHLSNNVDGSSPSVYYWATATDWPVVGNWDAVGCETIGVWRPSTGQWFLRNNNGSDANMETLSFGSGSDRPVVGDWDCDSKTEVGYYRPSNAYWHLKQANTTASPLVTPAFPYGNIGDYPITGDWNWNCHDTIGVFRTSNGVANWLLKNSLSGGAADVNFNFGLISDKPITGDWN